MTQQANLTWTQSEAISFCRLLEPIAAANGFHIALAGGCLHQTGQRPDLDVVVYKHGGDYDVVNCLKGFHEVGVVGEMSGSWYFRAAFNGKTIEFLFMERIDEPVSTTS